MIIKDDTSPMNTDEGSPSKTDTQVTLDDKTQTADNINVLELEKSKLVSTNNSNKRKSNDMSPPIDNEVLKRYMLNPEELISQNRYYLPTELEQKANDNKESQPGTSHNATPRKIKIPPIFLHEADKIKYKEVVADINKLVTGSFTTSYNSNILRINVSEEEDYKQLTKFYTINNLKYHTFQNPSDKPLSVVIKNVPLCLSTEEIKNELKDFPIIKITRLINKDKKPLPICAVDLTSNDDAKEIFKVNELYYTIVKVETRRKTSVQQCFRCQNFGHTRNYCHLSPRCVKCTDNHLTSECQKRQNDPPICANCGEHHPANFRGCSSYLTYIENRERTQTPSNRHNPMKINTTTTHLNQFTTNPHQPYADRVKNILKPPLTTPHTQQNENLTDSPILNSILKIVLDCIKSFLPQIKSFITNHILPSIINGP